VNRRDLLRGLATAAGIGKAWSRPAAAHSFGWRDSHFLLDGKPFLIRSGSMHYLRVPRAYWRDRMKKMRALGLNTLCTCVFWNAHEPRPGEFDFTGNLDIAEYVRTAQSEGLCVLVRPGPYVCAEWDFGGLPAWLLADPAARVRSADPKFLEAAGRYMKQVGKQLAPLQITRGGPILMVQVENEYGSFGSDKTYLNAVSKMIQDAGFDTTLYTSDGSGARNLAGGTLDGVLSVINFGDGSDARREFANFARFRSDVPRMCGEYWAGWFDHWGEKHHVTDPRRSEGLDWMLSQGISFNLYMAHGGTSFGYMAGANFGPAYQPDTSTYDYDAPIDEAGRLTEKFRVYREVIARHLPAGETLPSPPAPLPMIEIPRFELKQSASLFTHLPEPRRSEDPLPMEAVGQNYGFLLYRKKLAGAVKGTLKIPDFHDYAVICQGSRRLGTLDRRRNEIHLDVDLDGSAPLDILVENMGRVNFGPELVRDRKGILGKVLLGSQELRGWEIYSLPLWDPGRRPFETARAAAPGLYRGAFEIAVPGDTFLDLRGWGKGVAWVNGHCLGRYWRVGPQQTLFLPAPWLKRGSNEIVVLDLEDSSTRSIAGLKDPVYQTPA
jgi:beta-galactosidase